MVVHYEISIVVLRCDTVRTAPGEHIYSRSFHVSVLVWTNNHFLY